MPYATNKESAQTIQNVVDDRAVDNRTGDLGGVSVLQAEGVVDNVAELTDQKRTRPQQMHSTLQRLPNNHYSNKAL